MNKKTKILIIGALFLSQISVFAKIETVNAATTKKEMMLTNQATNIIENPTYTSDTNDYWIGEYLYYGNRDDGSAILWNVLSKDESDFGENSLLLFSNDLIGTDVFSKVDGTSVYGTSYIRNYVNDLNIVSVREKEALINSTKASVTDITLSTNTYSNPALQGEKIFLLSYDELSKQKYGFSTITAYGSDYARAFTSGVGYWARSGNTNPKRLGNAGNILSGGVAGGAPSTELSGIRPAVNVRKDNILFVSLANGGKNESVAVSGQLNNVGSSQYSQSKLTLLDNNQDVTITNVVRNYAGITLDYDAVGTGKYLSAVVLDDKGEEIISYGRVKDVESSKKGSANINLPSNFDSTGYQLKVFTEEMNGNKFTDYASNLKAVAVPTLDTSLIPSIAITEDKVNILNVYKNGENEVSTENSKDLTLSMESAGSTVPVDYDELEWTVENIAGFEAFDPVCKIDATTGKVIGLKSGVAKVTVKLKNGYDALNLQTYDSMIVVVPGDINKDGAVKSLDASTLSRVAASLGSLEDYVDATNKEYLLDLADMDGNGRLTSIDIVITKRMNARLIVPGN